MPAKVAEQELDIAQWNSRRSNMSSGMREPRTAQFSYWLSDIGFDADNAVGNRVA